MDDIPTRHSQGGSIFQEMHVNSGAEVEEEEEDEDSSDIVSQPSLTEVAVESPRMIVSPKMQDIHMIVQNEDVDSDRISSEYEDWHVNSDLRVEPVPLQKSGSIGQGHSTKNKRESVLWAENLAEEDALVREKARAEAEILVRSQGARARAEVRGKAEESTRIGSPLNANNEKELKAPADTKLRQDGEFKKKAEREIRLRAEEERLIMEEDERRRKSRDTSLQKERAESQIRQVEDPWEKEAQDIAVKIVQGIYDKISYKEYANFLGTKENHRVLRQFVLQLEPLPNSLLLALYKLVTRIYFIAEAQAIDRILEELSVGWTTANPTTHWGPYYKLCHIVLFSLLILNSDLHNAENNQSKFSKEEFVDNTLYAVQKEADKGDFNLKKHEFRIREELSVYYEALKHMSLPLLNRDDNRKTGRDIKNSRETKMKIGRRNSKISANNQANSSIDYSSSDDDSSVSSSPPSSIKRESRYTSNWRFHNNKPLPLLYRRESLDESFVLSNGTLWCMDSGIKINERNMVLPSNDRSTTQKATRPRIPSSASNVIRWITRSKSKSRSLLHGNKSPVAFFDGNTKWVNVRCKVYEGRIYVFKGNPPSIGPQNSLDDLEALKKSSDYYFVFSLHEALATLVQDNVVVNSNQTTSDHNDLNKRGDFTINIPAALHRNETVLEFQTSNIEEAQKFVQSVNFWAARLTPVPTAQFEIVSNEENGWSPQILSQNHSHEELESICLTEWKPLLSIGHLYSEQENYTEKTDTIGKIQVLESFAEYLQQNIDYHNKIKPLMFSTWQRTRNFDKAMDNWNKKYLYLNELNERTSIYLAVLKLTQDSING